jgi:NADH:ubiquinone oxidoreductase subunit C
MSAPFRELVGEVMGPDASLLEEFGVCSVDVEAQDWVRALRAARDDLGCHYFDWLSAVDLGDEGFRIVAHVWSLDRHDGILVRTLVARDAASLPTVTSVYRGADWHERETHEMFGIDFVGHPNLVPLLLPEQFDGHPLRKEFVLAARAAKAWPGAKEPGESEHSPSTRRRTLPPGVPDPSWGPRAPDAQEHP